MEAPLGPIAACRTLRRQMLLIPVAQRRQNRMDKITLKIVANAREMRQIGGLPSRDAKRAKIPRIFVLRCAPRMAQAVSNASRSKPGSALETAAQ